MDDTNPQVDAYLARAARWQAEMTALRALVRGCGLAESLKWGKPCYALDGCNVVLIVAFKDFCSLLFVKGALMKDPAGLLVAAGENSQAARQLRFTGAPEAATVEAYVREAIAVERAGLKVDFAPGRDFVLSPEFQQRLDAEPALKAAFEALTPGRQRAYHLHVSSAKQSATRASRVEKCVPRILAGKGLDD